MTRHYVHNKKTTVTETLYAKQEKALSASNAVRVIKEKDGQTQVQKQKNELKPLGSNVLLLSRRETPVDKHKEVGRWKLIEKELIARGLPVLGKWTPPQAQSHGEAEA